MFFVISYNKHTHRNKHPGRLILALQTRGVCCMLVFCGDRERVRACGAGRRPTRSAKSVCPWFCFRGEACVTVSDGLHCSCTDNYRLAGVSEQTCNLGTKPVHPRPPHYFSGTRFSKSKPGTQMHTSICSDLQIRRHPTLVDPVEERRWCRPSDCLCSLKPVVCRRLLYFCVESW